MARSNPGVYDVDLDEIDPEEPVFVLRGQDRFAGLLVSIWAQLAEEAGTPPAKVAEARELANAMTTWATQKTPD